MVKLRELQPTSNVKAAPGGAAVNMRFTSAPPGATFCHASKGNCAKKGTDLYNER